MRIMYVGVSIRASDFWKLPNMADTQITSHEAAIMRTAPLKFHMGM